MRKEKERKNDLPRIVDSLRKAKWVVDNLKSVREKLRFKIAEACRACDVSHQCWRDWEEGCYAPRLTTTILLIHFLHQKTEIVRLAKEFSEKEMRKQREAERREDAEFAAQFNEGSQRMAAWYAEHPLDFEELKLDSPELYTHFSELIDDGKS